ncbi:MAG: GNAT family N-acetyltransferase [Trueperaceae bacterium]
MNLLTDARHRIAAIEAAAADALVPTVELNLDGWRLRYGGGRARRTHSVLPERRGRRPVEEKLRQVEAFYRERSVAPRLQISPVALPTGLDAHLDAAGWNREEGAQVLWRDLSDAQSPEPEGVPKGAADRAVTIVRGEPADEAFDAVSITTDEETAAWARARIHALREAGRPVRPVAATAAGDPVAACLLVLEPAAQLVGLFQMATVPTARGRGVARGLLRAALADAREAGATGAYLQVDPRQHAALRLYQRERFLLHHRYHYRRAPDPD